MCGGWQDRDKCFHSHNIYMTIELAVQTLIWCLGPFISLQSTGFGALIKMIKINQSINMWSNYFNCLNIALAWSFSVSGEAWLWRSLFWTFLRKPGSLHSPLCLPNEICQWADGVEGRWIYSVFNIYLTPMISHSFQTVSSGHTDNPTLGFQGVKM